MAGTQHCYICNLFFCFCEKSITVHKLLDEMKILTNKPDLYCYETMVDTPDICIKETTTTGSVIEAVDFFNGD